MSVLTEFAEDFEAGLFGTDDGVAITVTYTPSGGDAISVQAVVNYAEDLGDAQWRAALQASAVIFVLESEILIRTYALSHGEVTNGPFVAGDIIVGTSGSTAGIATVETGSIVVSHLVGASFVAGETISSGTKSAVLSGVDEIATTVAPTYQDTVNIDGVEWLVVGKMSHSAGTWKLEVRRDLRPTFRK